jgi:hypothetical protein
MNVQPQMKWVCNVSDGYVYHSQEWFRKLQCHGQYSTSYVGKVIWYTNYMQQ